MENSSLKMDIIWYYLSQNSTALKVCNQKYEYAKK